MGGMDYFDLSLHGTPWLWLLIRLFQWGLTLTKKE
jgi:hypothetical protein